MRITPLAILLGLLCALTVSAQERHCTLKLNQLPEAPELFGFRMGMTKDQVKARVPQVVFGKTKAFGVLKTSINPDFDPRKNTWSGQQG